ncbi:MAG TPA: DUF4962 domain-containing protein [Bacilli bacterium]
MNKKQLEQPVGTPLSVPYRPDKKTRIRENPPRFTWMPEDEERAFYVLEVSASEKFPADGTMVFDRIAYNFFTPDIVFSPGTYYWRYAIDIPTPEGGLLRSDWSVVRSFTVPEGLPSTPLASRETRYRGVKPGHPRLWLNAGEVAEFRKRIGEHADYCGWNEFYEKSVQPWLDRELIPEPAEYPGGRRVIQLWRQMYMDCQEALYAVRHLSVAGVILEDSNLISRARKWLLHIAGWDTEGTTSRDYNDEAAFRIAGALAWGYDWLYGSLSDSERQAVLDALFRRTEQVAFHVIERSKIHQVPYDSHAVRSLSSVLVPCCIAMFDERPEAREWLDYTLEYYCGLYTPWGGDDGGWAEGPMYWTTGMAYLTDALNLVKKFCGIDIYKRPFFQATGDFPLYCYSPDTARASFCDQSNLGERPGLKTGALMRQFAGVTGNGMYQWYYEQTKAWDTEAEKKFFNRGWWDFRFDDMLYRHDYPEVPPEPPVRIEPVKWFRDIGWVAMHRRMDSPADHVMLLTKSSPYGSISHSHGDQNGILLHAYGEPLLIKSGYYIGFGTTMHRLWRRQTRSHNTVLIDGKGQYTETNKLENILAKGVIEEAGQRGPHGYVRADATAAYRHHVPYLKSFVREIYFVHGSYFTVVDRIELEQPGRADFLLHALRPFRLEGQRFYLEGEKADLYGKFVYCSSGKLSLSQHDEFVGVDPAEIEGLPKQWHLIASTNKAVKHQLVTLLVPARKGERHSVSYFVDDQGFGANVYFSEQDRTFHLNLSVLQ